MPVYVLTDPELAYRALAIEADKFGRGIFIEKFRPFFGNGLTLSTGDFYRRQRRLVQPSFHRDRIARYARTMIELAVSMARSWHHGDVIALDQRLRELTLTIAGRTLFATELGRRATEEFRRNVPILLADGLVRAFSPKVVERLPIPGNRRFDRAIARLHTVVDEVVAEARAAGGDRGDLLSVLLAARDEDTGEGMSDRQVHDEVVTLLTAGTETNAIMLAWFFAEIARHPVVQHRFHAELDAVLAGRPVTVEDLPRLTYTRQVINEVLRLHPPWLLMRRSRAAIDLGDVVLPAGVEVAASPHALHRDPRHFPDPDRFDPDRWAPDRVAALPRHAYLPFGTGPHHCPGHQFAQTEITAVAAAVAARWRLIPVAGQPIRATVHGALAQPSRLPMTVLAR